MFKFPEQFSAATKASLAARFDTLANFSARAFDNVEQVVDLNLGLMRASMEDSAATARQLIAARDAREILALGQAQIKPTTQKALTYSRHLIDIASATRAELSQVAETGIAERSEKLIGIVDNVAKNSPPAVSPAVELFKTAVGNANAGYTQFSKTTRKAVEAMEINLAAVVDRLASAGEKTTRRARK